ncbi:transposase [marine bacterium AO1-C]|nr:transposase [marine bacterium AO1-C]
MDKPYQISNPDGIYFITFAVVEWVDVFTRQRYSEIVLESLRYCQRKKGLIVYAWCIMSNHLHLILSAKPDFSLSDILRDFKKFTAKAIIQSIQQEPESRRNWMLWIFKSVGAKNSRNKKYQFWQQHNQPEELISNYFTEQKLNYLHQNPVTAGIVSKAEDYIYSSARNYAGELGLLDIQFLE